MVFKQSLLFGRAVLACEEVNMLKHAPPDFATRPNGASSAPEESYKLYFPHISNEDYYYKHYNNNSKVQLEEREATSIITGVVVLEGIMREAICSTQCCPCGLLIFRCLPNKRDEILEAAAFCNKDIARGEVQVVWLSSDDVILMHSELMMEPSAPCHSWQRLWSMAQDKIKEVGSRKGRQDSCPFPVSFFHFDLWVLQNLVSSWSKAVGHWNTEENRQSSIPRKMTPLEHMWIFFHLSLRWRRDLNVDAVTMSKALRELRIRNIYEIPSPLADNSLGLDMKVEQEHHGMMAVLTGNCDRLAEEMLESYYELCEMLERGKHSVKRYLTEAMQEVRQRYSAFPLYTSCKLKTFTEDCIESVPLSMFDLKGVDEWSYTMGRMLVESDMCQDKVYRSVYENAKPVYSSNDRCFLRLYGNVNALLNEMKMHADDDASIAPMKYRCEKLGSLSSTATDVLPLYGMGGVRWGSPFHLDTSNMTSVRLAESSEHCTPIWAVPTKSGGMSFMRIVPFLNRKRKQEHDVDSMDSLISRHMYRLEDSAGSTTATTTSRTATPGMTNEYLQSGLHWSTFVMDIDIQVDRVREHSAIPDVAIIARDAVSACNKVFETIFEGEKIKRHLVFASADNNEKSKKIGLHHHAILPPGLVFTSTACREMAGALNIVRHEYPSTLGMKMWADNNNNNNNNNNGGEASVYDCAIYPMPTREVGGGSSGCRVQHRGHCLRGPLQVKSDGTRKLECVLDTRVDLAPICANDILVHGPQFREDTGERVVFGKVVETLQGIQDLSDVAFFRKFEMTVMNENMRSTCRSTVTDIANEINKRTALFAPGEDPVGRLLVLINNLWNEGDGKRLMVRHMNQAVGRLGKKYNKHWISRMSNNSKFVYDSSRKTINLVVDTDPKTMTLPFCPRRPHNNDNNNNHHNNKGVLVTVGYSSKMIRFILFVSGCFKTSCQTDEKGHFLPKVLLSMPNVFVCPLVQREAERFLSTTFHGTRVRVTRIVICGGTQPNKDGDYEQIKDDLEVDGMEAIWEDSVEKEEGMGEGGKGSEEVVYTEDLVHGGKGVHVYVPEGNFSNLVRRLFMFIPDNILAFSLVTNTYIVCILSRGKEDANSSGHVYASSGLTHLLKHLRENKLLPLKLLDMLDETTMDHK